VLESGRFNIEVLECFLIIHKIAKKPYKITQICIFLLNLSAETLKFTAMGAKKNFVLDTNVILHDYKCIFNFQENDVYIPLVVLEELDKFKKGNEEINYNARQFAREMDSIVMGDDFF
jgi:hypothetical protein